jgi:hypothetical protein
VTPAVSPQWTPSNGGGRIGGGDTTAEFDDARLERLEKVAERFEYQAKRVDRLDRIADRFERLLRFWGPGPDGTTPDAPIPPETLPYLMGGVGETPPLPGVPDKKEAPGSPLSPASSGKPRRVHVF